MNRLGFWCFAAVCAVVGFAGCGEGGTARNVPQTVPSISPSANLSLVPPPGQIYLGVFVNPSQTPQPPIALLDNFEQTVGRRMGISTHYYGFYDSFPGQYEIDDVANGRIPVDSWDCQPSNAAVASGVDDTAIRNRADAIKAFGHPIFLRYMWEMNLPATPTFRNICYDAKTDLPNGVFSPQEYIAAWTRIRAIFAQEGVTNVTWVWNPSGAKNPLPYYVGSNECDWVGFDRYDDGNVSMFATYQQSYNWLAPFQKPIMVGETGATQQQQDLFFGQAVGTLQSNFPDIKAFMYFDSANINYAESYSWVIGSTQLATFSAMANDPYFSATQP